MNLKPSGTQSIDRAFALLGLLSSSDDERGIALAEVCRETGLAKATVHRLLRALVWHGLVTQDAQLRTFRLSGDASRLGWPAVVSARRLRDVGMPRLRTLARETQRTASLLLRTGNDVVVIAVQLGGAPAGVARYAWQRLPLITTASGIAILARMDEAECEKVIQANSPYFSRFRSLSLAGVRRSIRQARKDGYSAAVPDAGMRGLAMAICRGKQPVGALTLHAARTRMRAPNIRRLRPLMAAAVREIERDLTEPGSH